jgi:hypothetical protein
MPEQGTKPTAKIGGLARSYTKVTLLFANLPKDHPDYPAQQDMQNYVVGAIFGGALVGFALGLLLVAVI